MEAFSVEMVRLVDCGNRGTHVRHAGSIYVRL
jgi:hypothetical protein